MKFKAITLINAVFVTLGLSAGAQSLDQKPVLSIELANQIAQACVAKAEASGWLPISVAVYDDGGNLKAFQRMDNAYLATIQISQQKARSSAMFPHPTKAYAELAYSIDGKLGRVPGFANIPGLSTLAGGVPIMTAGGQHLGGVGVSGARGNGDEDCAQAGIEAVADKLK